jgi:hypothetical protein
MAPTAAVSKKDDVMTPAHLAEIEARHAAATEGPWVKAAGGQRVDFAVGPIGWITVSINAKKDQEFIAASWQDIADLLALAKEQAGEIERLRRDNAALHLGGRPVPPHGSGP